MKQSAHITLGTTSRHKLDAVEQACAKLGLNVIISGTKTSSGQNEQPVGFEETFSGALTRATSAKEQEPESIAVGIESGIFNINTSAPITLDIAIIVVLTPDGRQIVTTSEGVQFPQECVETAKNQGFKTTTVGSVITKQYGGDSTDPHSVLTKGTVTRTMTLVDALMVAFRQL